MKSTNKKTLEEIIRVDHAGERGAIKIYEGQLLALNTFKKDEKLISLMIADPEKTILCVSENGYGKKTALDDFPSHNRGGQGVISMKTSERNGSMVSAALVEDEDGIMLISDKGTMIRTSVSQVPTLSRNTQGVKVITPKEGEKLIECVTIPNEDNEEDE